MSKKKKLIICPISKIICDSLQEMYFIWWMIDLKKKGYINDFKRAKTYNLSDTEHYRLVEGDKDSIRLLLREHVYTPDFIILWNEKAENIFYCKHTKVKIKNCPFIIVHDHPVSIVEIKGSIVSKNDRTGSLSKFSVNRKWMFQKNKLYIELVECDTLFTQTFTPSRYLVTNTGSRKRSISWYVRNIEEYVKIRKDALL